jgi:hypothetical protein
MRASETFVRARARSRGSSFSVSQRVKRVRPKLIPFSLLRRPSWGGSEGCAWNRPRSFSLKHTHAGVEQSSLRSLGAWVHPKRARGHAPRVPSLSPTNHPKPFLDHATRSNECFLVHPDTTLKTHITLEENSSNNSFKMTYSPLCHKHRQTCFKII